MIPNYYDLYSGRGSAFDQRYVKEKDGAICLEK